MIRNGEEDKPFGGVNIILVGDFHQFPPVVSKKSAPLYYPSNNVSDCAEKMTGRKIHEQFTYVVCLKQQVRVTDSVWSDLLQHGRHGNCRAHHIETLRYLICTMNGEDPHSFAKNRGLVMLRHKSWSSALL